MTRIPTEEELKDAQSKAPFASIATQQRWLMALIATVQLVITLIVAPLATWSVGRIVEYGERITAIEATRFTNDDAVALEERIRDPLDDRLDRIEDKLDRIIEGGR